MLLAGAPSSFRDTCEYRTPSVEPALFACHFRHKGPFEVKRLRPFSVHIGSVEPVPRSVGAAFRVCEVGGLGGLPGWLWGLRGVVLWTRCLRRALWMVLMTVKEKENV